MKTKHLYIGILALAASVFMWFALSNAIWVSELSRVGSISVQVFLNNSVDEHGNQSKPVFEDGYNKTSSLVEENIMGEKHNLSSKQMITALRGDFGPLLGNESTIMNIDNESQIRFFGALESSANLSNSSSGSSELAVLQNNTMFKVCVLIPVSSKQQSWQSIDDSFLIRYSFFGLAKTCEPAKYSYSFYVGYDLGDNFFDNPKTLKGISEWSQNHIPFASVIFAPFLNQLRKPGPIMNFLSKTAYNDRCDFLYRINDDTEAKTPWTSEFVAALQQMDPPWHGVVGPICRQGNTAILTHDFVHRQHLEFFGSHYPAQLTDWWLDDWITFVYGANNTRKLDNVEVVHHMVPSRYLVARENEKLLRRLIGLGRMSLSARVSLKLVSFSLFGSNPLYLEGSLANADLVGQLYPGWIMRVYHDQSVPPATLRELAARGVQLVDMEHDPLRNGMTWRFLPAEDGRVQRFLSRDADSRLSSRERAAVAEWEAGGLAFHVMRDHPSHGAAPVFGGLWGARGGALSDLRARLERRAVPARFHADMDFLHGEVWPQMKEAGVLVHDAFSCGGSSRPWPTPRRGVEHVGSVVLLSGSLRRGDTDLLEAAVTQGRECPPAVPA